MAKSLYDLFNKLAEAEVPEKEANELVDEYLKNVSSSMTQGIKPKTEQFNPKATYGGFRFPEVSPEEIEEASASIKEKQLEQTFDPILKKQEASDALRQKYAPEIEAANIQKTRKEYFENKAKEEELNKKIKMRENIAESAEARGKSNFGDFVKEEAKVNEAPRTYLTPDEERILKSVEIGEIKLSDALKALKETRAAKMVSSAAKGGLKIAGRLGQVAEPFIAYKAGGELLEGLSKIPEFNNLKDEEKRQLIGDITGSGMEFAGAGLGTAGSALGLAGSALGSGTLAALGASVAAPAMPLMAVGALSKYGGPHLAEGAKRASQQTGGTMMGRLGGDPNAVNPPPSEMPKAPVLAEVAPSKAKTIDVMDAFQESDLFKKPDVNEVKRYIVEQAKARNIDPALALAQIGQESSFDPTSISKAGAMGLGQMFPDAFTNAQEIDKTGSLKDLTYEKMIQPENWKQQVDASFDYMDWIKNRWKPKNVEEQLRHYIAGGKGSKYWDKPESMDYGPKILKDAEAFRKELENMPTEKEASTSSSVDRSPSSTKFSAEERADALRRVQNFLRTGEGDLKPEDAPLLFGPVPDAKEYEKFREDQKKLLELKDKKDILEGKRKIPFERSSEKSEMVPTEEEPSTTPEQDAAQKQADALVAQQTSLQQQLKDAQKKARESEFLGGLGKAAERILAGGVGFGSQVAVKPAEDTVFKRMIEDRDRPIKELEQTIKIQGEDPNSDVSNSMRELLTKDLEKVGMNVNLAGLSYNQMKDIYSPLSSMAARLETSKLKKEEKVTSKRKEDEQKIDAFVTNRKDTLEKSSRYKAYSDASEAENLIANAIANPNAITDISVLYKFIKDLDKNSAVREGETALAMKANGLFGRLETKLKDYLGNPRLLKDDVVNDIRQFADIAKQKAKRDMMDEVKAVEKQLEERSKTAGLDVDVKDKMKGVIPYYDEYQIEKNSKEIDNIVKKDARFGGDRNKVIQWLKESGQL